MTDRSQKTVNDYARQPLRSLFLWGLPIAAVIIADLLPLPTVVDMVVITGAFAWIGTACLLNALHCNRVHCWFVGPWCLLVALMLFANAALGFRPMDIPFATIANVGSIVAVVLWLVPELVLGKYFGAARGTPNEQ